MGTFHWFFLIFSVSSIYCYNEEEEEAYLVVKPSISSFVNGSTIVQTPPNDATTLQRTKDAGLFDYDTDDDWDTVHFFDYTVDSPDDHAAANDYDLKAGFPANHQQVKILTLTHTYGTVFLCTVLYRITVPYRIKESSNV
jgi:hypothetical protein